MKIILVIGVLMISTYSYAQLITPPDIATIEAMIAKHKSVNENLGKRKDRAAANAGLSLSVKQLSEDVNKITKLTSDRLATGYQTLAYAQQMTKVAGLTLSISTQIDDYTSFFIKNTFKNPLIFKWYERSYKGISFEVKKCTRLFYSGILLGNTHIQKLEYLNELQASLEIIKYQMERTLYMCKGIVALDMSYQESFNEIMNSPDFKAKVNSISTGIINSYSR